jgi:cytochrome b6-f complex iron-sulfur subunit
MPRRDLLGIVASWSTAGALLFALLGILRLPKAAVLPSPSKKFRVRLPESLEPGKPFLLPGRSVAIFRDGGGVYAVSTVCTHLGCIVRAEADRFQCPCHGSQFKLDGTVARGPAPKALPWLAVSVSEDEVIVDEGKVVPQGTRARA